MKLCPLCNYETLDSAYHCPKCNYDYKLLTRTSSARQSFSKPTRPLDKGCLIYLVLLALIMISPPLIRSCSDMLHHTTLTPAQLSRMQTDIIKNINDEDFTGRNFIFGKYNDRKDGGFTLIFDYDLYERGIFLRHFHSIAFFNKDLSYDGCFPYTEPDNQ